MVLQYKIEALFNAEKIPAKYEKGKKPFGSI